jgi:hypothetical protein
LSPNWRGFWDTFPEITKKLREVMVAFQFPHILYSLADDAELGKE